MSVLNTPALDLVAATNQVLRARKESNESVIASLNWFVTSLGSRKKESIGILEGISRDVKSVRDGMKDVIRVITEGDILYVFFESEEELMRRESSLMRALTKFGMSDAKKIGSIGMFKCIVVKSDMATIVSEVEKAVCDGSADVTIVSDTEALIRLQQKEEN
jgi:hypothetical protein